MLPTSCFRGTAETPVFSPESIARESACLNGLWNFIPCSSRDFPVDVPSKLDSHARIPVPGSWRSPGEFKTPRSWVRAPAGWYSRKINIPGFWRGKRIWLHFEGVHYEALVFLNNRFIGGHRDGFGSFDLEITDDVRSGKKNDLAVWVAHVPRNKNGLALAPGRQWHPGIVDDVYLMAAPGPTIESIRVFTSFQDQAIGADISVSSAGSRETDAEIRLSVMDGHRAAKLFRPRRFKLPAGGSRSISFSEVWEGAETWSPPSPKLYTLRAELWEGGSCRDVLEKRFGCRDFRVVGEEFHLNGRPIRLRSASPALSLFAERTEPFFRLLISALKNANFNCVRTHAKPYPPIFYDLADEMGIMVIDEAAVSIGGYDLGDGRFWKNYRHHIRELIRRDEVHPSVVMWSAENELGVANWREYSDLLENLRGIAGVIRQEDPSRPYMFEADGDLQGVTPVVNLHYPHECVSFGNEAYPDTLYWFSRRNRFKHFREIIDGTQLHGKPFFIGEFIGLADMHKVECRNGFSFIGGDEVYCGDRWKEACADLLAMEIGAYRSQGVAGLAPWPSIPFGLETLPLEFDMERNDLSGPEIKPLRISSRPGVNIWTSLNLNPYSASKPEMVPNEIYQRTRKVFSPVAAFVEEYDGNFYSGDECERTITVINDSYGPADIICRWFLEFPGEGRVGEGAFEARLDTGEILRKIASFQMPRVTVRKDIAFGLRLEVAGKVVYEDEKDYTLYPKHEEREGPGGKVLVIDPERSLDGILAGRSMEVLSGDFSSLGDEDILNDVSYILIGGNVIPAGLKDIPGAFKQWIGRGGRAVVFEQKESPGDIKIDRDKISAIAFARRPSHPVLKGIGDRDLRFWKPDSIVSICDFVKPCSPGMMSLIDTGGPKGLEWASLVEWRHGEGMILLSQLNLCEAYPAEPAAATLVENIFSYLKEKPSPKRRAGIFWPRGNDVKCVLEKFAPDAEVLSELTPGSLEKLEVLVLDAGETASRPGGEREEKLIRDFVKRGGDVLVLNLGSDNAASVSSFFPFDLDVRETSRNSIAINPLARGSHLLDGLSDSDFYWVAYGRRGDRSSPVVKCLVDVKGASHFELARPEGSIVNIPSGKGSYILCQVCPPERKNYSGRYKRILCAILDNLGIFR